MKRKYFISALLFASLFTACKDTEVVSFTDGDTATVTPLPADVVNGELFVKFKPEIADILDKAGVITRGGKMTRSSIPSVDEVLDIAGAYTFERVFPLDTRNEARTRKSGLHLWYIVRFDKDADVLKIAKDMASLAEVAHVEFNHEIKRAYNPEVRAKGVSNLTMNAAKALKNGNAPFNDPRLSDQWHYINDGTVLNNEEDLKENPQAPKFEKGTYAGNDVNCKEAWKKCTGDPSIIVAVLDEGVMYSHPDLKANMWVNPNETLGSLTDADGNGYCGDRHGYNFVTDNGLISWGDPNDSGHGTHVAGTIAAVNNNGEGVCGIAGGSGNNDGVKIMSCQLFSGNMGVTLLGEAKAVKYAADNGAVILQCSWGYNSGLANPLFYMPGPRSDKEWMTSAVMEKEVMEYFLHNAGDPNGVIEGGVIIFAAGNEYSAMAGYPGAYGDFISVASIGPDGTPAPYSNYGTPSGSKNMITAPGGDGEGTQRKRALVLSTMPQSAIDLGGNATEGGYGYMEGTSMACPHVSGVAALGLSYAAKLHKHFRADDYRKLLLESVTPIDNKYDGFKSYWYGWNENGVAAPCFQLDLNAHRGKMGGLIDAAKVLANVEGSSYGGRPMKVPNVTVQNGASQQIDLIRVFGKVKSATCQVEDAAVASVEYAAGTLVVKALKEGATKATVSVEVVAEDGSTQTQSQSFVITVRAEAGNGWM